MVSHDVQCQEIYSHFGIHVVPWIPFSSLVEVLASVNSFHYWLLLRGSLSWVVHIRCTQETYSIVCLAKLCPSQISPRYFLVLVDGGCLNASLPMDLFLSLSTHLSLGIRFRVYDSTLGIAVINANFPRYWVVGIP